MLWSLYQTILALSIEKGKKGKYIFTLFRIILHIENYLFLLRKFLILMGERENFAKEFLKSSAR